jgi:hypothetical protein
MSLFRRKTDPLHERARELNEQINALEAEIRRLHHTPPPTAAPPVPAPAVVRDHTPPPRPPANTRRSPHFAPSAELVLEEVQQSPVATVASAPREHRNELGVRKLDLTSLFSRVTRQFRGPAASNPKLVSYLAAGSIQGLRPLRYEKRIARNRFIVAAILLFACLWGLLAIILRQY